MISPAPVDDDAYAAWLEEELKDPAFVKDLVRDVLQSCLKVRNRLTDQGRARARLVVDRLDQHGVEVLAERKLLEELEQSILDPAWGFR